MTPPAQEQRPDLSPATSDPAPRDYSVTMGQANVYALAFMLPAAALLIGLHVAFWGWESLWRPLDVAPWYVSMGLLVGGIVVHEWIHGLAWWFFGKKAWSEITFGFQWKTLTPYAHCKVPMPARAYRLGAAAPGVVLGLLPAAVGIGMGWGGWTAFGLLFTVAAGGDALILWLLRRVPAHVPVADHPTQAGCYVYEPAALAR